MSLQQALRMLLCLLVVFFFFIKKGSSFYWAASSSSSLILYLGISIFYSSHGKKKEKKKQSLGRARKDTQLMNDATNVIEHGLLLFVVPPARFSVYVTMLTGCCSMAHASASFGLPLFTIDSYRS
ncbi:hypothetical protein V8C37DRAFT_387098 [Trichoderma ceciliae]